MNQSIRITNVSSTVVSLSSSHQILPGKFIDVSQAEAINLSGKINMFKRMKLISIDYVPMGGQKGEPILKVEAPLPVEKEYIKATPEQQEIIDSYKEEEKRDHLTLDISKELKGESSPTPIVDIPTASSTPSLVNMYKQKQETKA